MLAAPAPRGRILAIVASVLLVATSCPTSSEGDDTAPPPRAGGRSGHVVISVDRGALVLADRGRDVTLRQPRPGPTAPAAASFRRGDRWFTTTKVSSSSSHRIVWATTDPSTSIVVSTRSGSDGAAVVALTTQGGRRADAVSMSFEADRHERFVGFGERSNAVDQRGNQVENYVGEGPYVAGDYPGVRAVAPPVGLRERRDATYFPIPWLLSTRGYGVLVTNDERSLFQLGHEDRRTWSVAVDAPTMGMRVWTGEDPASVLSRFTAHVGRQPDAGTKAVLGPWIQPGGTVDTPDAVVDWINRTDTPVSLVQTYLHYLPCGDDQSLSPKERRAGPARYHRAGLAVTTYMNPMVCTSYADVWSRAAGGSLLTEHSDGSPYVYGYFGSQRFEVGQFDFTDPAAGDLYRDVLGRAVDDGYDGWMEDFGEYTPLDGVGSDGITGTAGHNAYPRHYHAAAHKLAGEVDRPLVRFVRSGWTGTAASSPVVWGGDPSTTWDFDGLRSTVTNGLTMGLSGVGVWGSDIGGFFTLTAPKLTPELLQRWIEVGAFSGVMRSQASGFGSEERPQIFDPAIAPTWRRYSKLRTQLAPYLRVAADQYRSSGLPLMRHLLLAHPDDQTAVQTDDEYLLGDSLLVAPVLEPGATARKVYLPAGRWFDLTSALRYREADGSFSLGAVPIVEGRRTQMVPAAVDQVPLFAAAGSVISLLPADVDTLADQYADGTLVAASERSDRRHLFAFPSGTTRSTIEPGEVATSRVQTGRSWSLSVRGAPHGRIYEVEASFAALGRFTPCSVAVGGRRVPRSAWTWNPTTKVFTASVGFDRGPLAVNVC